MSFTAQELANTANAALDFYIKGPAFLHTIQERPLYDALRSAQKNFPGGKANISLPVKGEFATTVQGFSHDDTVNYVNPANIKRVQYPWREHHGGITLTMTS